MGRAFDAAKVGAMVWPEIGGIALLILSHLGARFVDGSFGLEKPFRRSTDYVHGAGILLPAYLVATDRSPDMAKAIAFAEVGILGGAAGTIAYDATVGTKVEQIKVRKLAEKAIKEHQRITAGAGNPGLTAAEKQAIIAARARERGAGTRQYADDEIRA